MLVICGGSAATEPIPEPGTVLEKSLAGGESHLYRLDWQVGKEYWLTTDQKGIDLSVSLVTAGGESRLTVDSPSGRWGGEWIRFRVEPGDEAIEIRSLSEHSAQGSYRLSLELRSEAAPEVRRLGSVERAMTAAGRLNHIDKRESQLRALTHYRDALAGWNRLGREEQAVNTRFLIAILERRLDKSQESLVLLREVLRDFQHLEDAQGEARTWMEIGSTLRMQSELDEAEQAYERSLELWLSIGDLHGQTRVLNFLGLIHMRTDPQSALASYREVVRLSRVLGDDRQEGVAFNNLGGLFSMTEEPRKALEHFEQALRIHQSIGDRRQEAVTWNNMASVHRRTGRFQEALEGYLASLEVRKEFGDRRGQGRVLNNLGLTWLALGDADQATEALHQALKIRRESEDPQGEVVTLHNLGLVHAEFEAWDEALKVWTEVLDRRRKLKDRDGEASALIALGRAAGALGRLTQARQHLEGALTLLDEQKHPWRQARARWALGKVLTEAGELEAASTLLEQSLQAYRALDDPMGIGDTLLALAQVERAQAERQETGNLARAYAYTQEVLDLLETVRADVESLGLRSSFLGRYAETFEFAMGLAMDLESSQPSQGWNGRALEISERARARSFIDRLAESGVQTQKEGNAPLLDRQEALLEQFSMKVGDRRRQLERGDVLESARLASEIKAVRAQLEEVERQIRQQSAAWSSVSSQALQVEEIQALLDAETALLEYSLGRKRSFLWFVTTGGVQSYELPGRAEIEALAREVYDDLRLLEPRPRKGAAEAAQRLSRLLLGPLADQLDGQRLAIVADGALHYLPFAALPHPSSPSDPLLVHHEMVSLPSASALGVRRQTWGQRPRAQRLLAVLADPIFESADPRLTNTEEAKSVTLASLLPAYSGTRSGELELSRLPWSRWEAEAIASHVDVDQAFVALGFDADLDTVRKGQLQQYRVVHFATHGVVESEHPELSALVLSLYDAEGRSQEGFLRLPQIYHLELKADLVVLSGCETALGQEVRGEGLVGLSRGFFAAGARRLMASLWRVQDRSSAELMNLFYQRLLRESEAQGDLRPAALLREAQLQLRKEEDFSDPYFWAAFAIYGDW